MRRRPIIAIAPSSRRCGGGLDGEWAFEDVQTGYILLKGLELKDQTASLGRYMLEDFAHYVVDPQGRRTTGCC